MSSYFVNSTFPVTLPRGQESILGQIPLYSGYTDPLRNYPSVAYGANCVQEKAYPSSFYQQTNNDYGRASAIGACNYSTASFYREKNTACGHYSMEEQPFVSSQDHLKTECTGSTGKLIYNEVDEHKSVVPVYPWMQRMNSCNGMWFIITLCYWTYLVI